MLSPVLTSKSSFIGDHEIVGELGPISVKPPGLEEWQQQQQSIEQQRFNYIGESGSGPSGFDTTAEALHALKAKVREVGGNGVINVETGRWSASGLAVVVRRASSNAKRES